MAEPARTQPLTILQEFFRQEDGSLRQHEFARFVATVRKMVGVYERHWNQQDARIRELEAQCRLLSAETTRTGEGRSRAQAVPFTPSSSTPTTPENPSTSSEPSDKPSSGSE